MVRKLRRIAIIGAGGLGHPAAFGLVSQWSQSQWSQSQRSQSQRSQSPQPANLGELELTIFDRDTVELSNLNRQILFETSDIGSSKAEVLADRLAKLLPPASTIRIASRPQHITAETIRECLLDQDFIIDACDSIATKFLLNDYCASTRTPWCYGGAVGLTGQWMVVRADRPDGTHAPCLRCMFGDDAEIELEAQTLSCEQAGILGPVAGIIGFSQATATVRSITDSMYSPPAVSELNRFAGATGRLTQHRVFAAAECRFAEPGRLGSRKIVERPSTTEHP